ncbi:MAG: c-type cytochrome [bacterium]
MSTPNIKKIDFHYKWGLLITSLLTLILLGIAAWRENVTTEWRIIRQEYAEILQEKATDERGQMIADQFETQIVQNYVPKLQVVDRCMTCHPGIDDPRMRNEEQPYRTHPGTILASHPPEQFGCTVCHRGQGRALVFEEAKAEGYHWDYPLLPVNLTQSSCGQCHSADEVKEQGGEKFALGKELFETKGCYSCHKLNGKGGSLGPGLDRIGEKVKALLPMANVKGPHTLANWLIEHFRDPQLVVADSQMRPPQLSEPEIEALTVYMLAQQERDFPQTYLSSGKILDIYKESHPDPLSGEELFKRYCASCHDTGEYSRYDKFFRKFFPAIRGKTYVQVATAEYLEATIRAGHPGTLMPAWGQEAGGLSDGEIVKIREYLQQVEVKPNERLPLEVVQNAKNPASVVQGNIMNGATLFGRHCTSCHTTELAPDLFNPVFQKHASDGFIAAAIAYGRLNTAMPGFLGARGGFNEQEINDLTVFIRAAGKGGTGGPLSEITYSKSPMMGRN